MHKRLQQLVSYSPILAFTLVGGGGGQGKVLSTHAFTFVRWIPSNLTCPAGSPAEDMSMEHTGWGVLPITLLFIWLCHWKKWPSATKYSFIGLTLLFKILEENLKQFIRQPLKDCDVSGYLQETRLYWGQLYLEGFTLSSVSVNQNGPVWNSVKLLDTAVSEHLLLNL